MVRSFQHLGSIINDNLVEEEYVKKNIVAGNRAYFSMANQKQTC